MVEEAFSPIPVLKAPFFDQEVVGIPRLTELGRRLYGETDPTIHFYRGRPYSVLREDDEFVMRVELPFAMKEEIQLMRHGDEIVIEVGTWRRNFVLPRVLVEAATLGAKFDDHTLKIRFAAPPRSSSGGKKDDRSRSSGA
jgi:arsenite-transporting ATPase